MRARYFVIPALLVVGLLAAAGGVYAYDYGRKDTIADGVTIGGVDVGGMKVDAARRPSCAPRSSTRSTVPCASATRTSGSGSRPRAQASPSTSTSSVDAAVASSREGNMFVRTWDEVTGKEKTAAMDVDVRVRPQGRPLAGQARAARRSTARPSTPTSTSRRATSTPSRPRTGWRSPIARLRRDIQRTLLEHRARPRDGARAHRHRAGRRSRPPTCARSTRSCSRSTRAPTS